MREAVAGHDPSIRSRTVPGRREHRSQAARDPVGPQTDLQAWTPPALGQHRTPKVKGFRGAGAKAFDVLTDGTQDPITGPGGDRRISP